MPPKKKTKETSLRIKPFKNDPKSVWWDNKHYMVLEGKAKLIAGGAPSEADMEKVKAYFKRKKLI